MPFHVTLSDGTTQQYDQAGDDYTITPAGVLDIITTEDGVPHRRHYSPTGWTSVVGFATAGKKPKRAVIPR